MIIHFIFLENLKARLNFQSILEPQTQVCMHRVQKFSSSIDYWVDYQGILWAQHRLWQISEKQTPYCLEIFVIQFEEIWIESISELLERLSDLHIVLRILFWLFGYDIIEICKCENDGKALSWDRFDAIEVPLVHN